LRCTNANTAESATGSHCCRTSPGLSPTLLVHGPLGPHGAGAGGAPRGRQCHRSIFYRLRGGRAPSTAESKQWLGLALLSDGDTRGAAGKEQGALNIRNGRSVWSTLLSSLQEGMSGRLGWEGYVVNRKDRVSYCPAQIPTYGSFAAAVSNIQTVLKETAWL
jgi:hypothetical protein